MPGILVVFIHTQLAVPHKICYIKQLSFKLVMIIVTSNCNVWSSGMYR